MVYFIIIIAELQCQEQTRTAQFLNVATNLGHFVSWIYRWSQVLLQPYNACTTNVETSKFDSLVSRHLVGLPCCYCSNICCSACWRRGYSCLCSYNSRVYRSFAPASDMIYIVYQSLVYQSLVLPKCFGFHAPSRWKNGLIRVIGHPSRLNVQSFNWTKSRVNLHSFSASGFVG